MDHSAAGRLGLPLLLAFFPCFLLLSGCSARAASRPLFAFPAAVAGQATSHERLHIALNATSMRVGQALAALTAVAPASAVSPFSVDSSPLAAAARDDCTELLEESLQLLASAGAPGAAHDDALTWLSAALTNHDTCADSLEEAGISDTVSLADMAAARGMVRDSLAMYAATAAETATARTKDDLAGNPVKTCGKHNKQVRSGFPGWLSGRDRRLLLGPAASLVENADMVVAKDGTGTHSNISDAVKAAPECSERRTVIYVKAGRYDENVKVGMKKTNLVFVGDGKGVTVVAGCRSADDNNYTTFRTATFELHQLQIHLKVDLELDPPWSSSIVDLRFVKVFAASGSGFIMRDMTVENWAGPARHQAVALRVSADRAVVYRCNLIGYQDTLYAHSNRQFYRECDVYGTVDFVFGNAAAVLQGCNLWARAPLPGQKVTVTAQNRREPTQNTGLVIHACRIVPTPDLAQAPALATAADHAPTYLGRPWRLYSRVVVMMSYIGGHVRPEGWLEWNDTFALDTLYFGEYMNYGPGAGVAGRVPWPGHRVINDTAEAERFTVAQFILGSSWLPATGVSFLAGLSL